jgi:hypothetical protein
MVETSDRNADRGVDMKPQRRKTLSVRQLRESLAWFDSDSLTNTASIEQIEGDVLLHCVDDSSVFLSMKDSEARKVTG